MARTHITQTKWDMILTLEHFSGTAKANEMLTEKQKKALHDALYFIRGGRDYLYSKDEE